MSDTPQPEFTIYALGVVSMSVCASNALSPSEVEERANRESPTGIRSDWRLCEDERFLSGHSNPCPCNTHPRTHRHYLLNC